MTSFDEGMRLFKSADYQAASEQFLAAVGEDDQNHKAWNALGICLSKTAQYEDAGVCFDNAIALDPDNETYRKNKARNDKKRGVQPEESLELDDEPAQVKKTSTPSITSQYSPVQIAVGVVAVFILLMFMGACVASLGGGGSKQVTPPAVVQTAVPTQAASVQQAAVSTPVVTQPTVAQNSVTPGQRNAAKKALSYLKYSAFSHDGLVKQLEFEKFSHEDAVYGADQTGADWNEQAAKKAQSYLDYSAFSRDGLIKQLEFEKFTPEQAVYGVNAVGL